MPVTEKLPALARYQTAVFANVFGYQTEDYVEVARVLEDHAGVAAYELYKNRDIIRVIAQCFLFVCLPYCFGVLRPGIFGTGRLC